MCVMIYVGLLHTHQTNTLLPYLARWGMHYNVAFFMYQYTNITWDFTAQLSHVSCSLTNGSRGRSVWEDSSLFEQE